MRVRVPPFVLCFVAATCAGILLGGPTACMLFDCPEPWGAPESFEFGATTDLVGVGAATTFDSYVAVGLGGLVSVSDGTTATAQTPINVALRGVGRHQARLLAIGDQGTIVVSDDSGATWFPRVSGASGSLLGIAHAEFVDADYLVVVGVEAIVVSSDAGETWTVVPEPALGWGTLRGVFATTERVYAVGDAGVAWSSATPAGQWNAEPVGTTANLLGVGTPHPDSASPDLLLVPAADSTVLVRDANGWRTVPLELDGEIVRFAGGYLLTSTGAIYDLDGTAAASLVPVEFDFEPAAIHADSLGLIAVGSEGQAARATLQTCGISG